MGVEFIVAISRPKRRARRQSRGPRGCPRGAFSGSEGAFHLITRITPRYIEHPRNQVPAVNIEGRPLRVLGMGAEVTPDGGRLRGNIPGGPVAFLKSFGRRDFFPGGAKFRKNAYMGEIGYLASHAASLFNANP